VRNCDRKSQRDRETHTLLSGPEGKLALERFWRDQLNRVKERAESQAIKPASRGD